MSEGTAAQAESRHRRVPAGALQGDVTAAITRAVFREWALTGYAALSMEAVAKRAGVGKAAIYRRWPSKLPMVADLLTKAGAPAAETPDTGSLEGDVREFLLRTARLLRHPLARRILPDLHAEMSRTPELAVLVRSGIQVERRDRAGQILRRAVGRGELRRDLDEELALDLLGAPLHWRLVVTGLPTGPDYIGALTVVTMAGLRAA